MIQENGSMNSSPNGQWFDSYADMLIVDGDWFNDNGNPRDSESLKAAERAYRKGLSMEEQQKQEEEDGAFREDEKMESIEQQDLEQSLPFQGDASEQVLLTRTPGQEQPPSIHHNQQQQRQDVTFSKAEEMESIRQQDFLHFYPVDSSEQFHSLGTAGQKQAPSTYNHPQEQLSPLEHSVLVAANQGHALNGTRGQVPPYHGELHPAHRRGLSPHHVRRTTIPSSAPPPVAADLRSIFPTKKRHEYFAGKLKQGKHIQADTSHYHFVMGPSGYTVVQNEEMLKIVQQVLVDNMLKITDCCIPTPNQTKGKTTQTKGTSTSTQARKLEKMNLRQYVPEIKEKARKFKFWTALRCSDLDPAHLLPGQQGGDPMDDEENTQTKHNTNKRNKKKRRKTGVEPQDSTTSSTATDSDATPAKSPNPNRIQRFGESDFLDVWLEDITDNDAYLKERLESTLRVQLPLAKDLWNRQMKDHGQTRDVPTSSSLVTAEREATVAMENRCKAVIQDFLQDRFHAPKCQTALSQLAGDLRLFDTNRAGWEQACFANTEDPTVQERYRQKMKEVMDVEGKLGCIEEEWARALYVLRSVDDSNVKAMKMDGNRQIVLRLVYDIVVKWRDEFGLGDEFAHALASNDNFGRRRLVQLVRWGLLLDRFNCLYNMEPVRGTSNPGRDWFCDFHLDPAWHWVWKPTDRQVEQLNALHQWWETTYGIRDTGLLNKKLVLLITNKHLGLTDPTQTTRRDTGDLIRWMQPSMSPLGNQTRPKLERAAVSVL